MNSNWNVNYKICKIKMPDWLWEKIKKRPGEQDQEISVLSALITFFK